MCKLGLSQSWHRTSATGAMQACQQRRHQLELVLQHSPGKHQPLLTTASDLLSPRHLNPAFPEMPLCYSSMELSELKHVQALVCLTSFTKIPINEL